MASYRGKLMITGSSTVKFTPIIGQTLESLSMFWCLSDNVFPNDVSKICLPPCIQETLELWIEPPVCLDTIPVFPLRSFNETSSEVLKCIPILGLGQTSSRPIFWLEKSTNPRPFGLHTTSSGSFCGF